MRTCLLKRMWARWGDKWKNGWRNTKIFMRNRNIHFVVLNKTVKSTAKAQGNWSTMPKLKRWKGTLAHRERFQIVPQRKILKKAKRRSGQHRRWSASQSTQPLLQTDIGKRRKRIWTRYPKTIKVKSNQSLSNPWLNRNRPSKVPSWLHLRKIMNYLIVTKAAHEERIVLHRFHQWMWCGIGIAKPCSSRMQLRPKKNIRKHPRSIWTLLRWSNTSWTSIRLPRSMNCSPSALSVSNKNTTSGSLHSRIKTVHKSQVTPLQSMPIYLKRLKKTTRYECQTAHYKKRNTKIEWAW